MSSSTLRLSENRRFLVRDDGSPFFYLADTAWELFHRLDRAEAEFYLRTRAVQGFTVIQAVVLAEEDGLNVLNADGELPLFDNDPTQPNEAYFRHVDFVVQKAAELGLTIGMLPTWGDKWNRKWGIGPEVFTPENAMVYGEFLGRRYKDSPIIWILGGDRPIETPEHRAIIDSMAAGIEKGDEDRHLMTFHPSGNASSSQWVHEAPWLDFNMCQSGHLKERDNGRFISEDYARRPIKPCLDGEPGYENIPSDLKIGEDRLNAANVRRYLYQALFAGACGHTYGCNEIWQCWRPGLKPLFEPQMSWRDALQLLGGSQMQHARTLLESVPFVTRVPDAMLVMESSMPLYATRDAEGSYALVYFPSSVSALIDLSNLKSDSLKASWFDPRLGSFSDSFVVSGDNHQFQPPVDGEDWVLVLKN